MKKILTIIYTVILFLLVIINLRAGVYVSPSGSNTSPYDTWAKAATTFSAAMAVTDCGDTLFIDGGVDSVVYNQNILIQSKLCGPGYGSMLYIMAGKYAPNPTNHSGRIIIRHGSSIGLYLDAYYSGTGVKGIYIKGLEVRDGTELGCRLVGGVRNVVLDSIMFINQDNCGINIDGDADNTYSDTTIIVYNVEIKNCAVVSRTDHPGTRGPADDNIRTKYSNRLIIHDNFLWQRNQQSWNSSGTEDYNHVDNFQTAYGCLNQFLYNNICIVDSGANGHNFILGSGGRAGNIDTIFTYNNFLFNGGRCTDYIDASCKNRPMLYYRGPEAGPSYAPYVLSINNTTIGANWSTFNVFQGYDVWKPYDKNTIMAYYGETCSSPSKCSPSTWSHQASGVSVDSCGGNLIWRADGGSLFAGPVIGSGGSPTGTPSSWSNYVSVYGGTGATGDPLFDIDFCEKTFIDVSPFFTDDANGVSWTTDGLVTFSNSSPAIDAGVDVSFYIEDLFGYLPGISTDDIAGNPRNGTWDIGAFEFQQGIADTIPIFSFTSQTGKELNTEYIATSPITGVDSVSHFWTTTSASFKINYNGTYSTAMKTADPDNGADTVYVKNTTGGSYSTTYTETIVGGGHSEDFDVTTKADLSGQQATIGRFSDGKIIRDSTGKIIKVK